MPENRIIKIWPLLLQRIYQKIAYQTLIQRFSKRRLIRSSCVCPHSDIRNLEYTVTFFLLYHIGQIAWVYYTWQRVGVLNIMRFVWFTCMELFPSIKNVCTLIKKKEIILLHIFLSLSFSASYQFFFFRTWLNILFNRKKTPL